MGNKTITYILSALFVITFGLAVFGYMNRDSVNDKPAPTPTPTTNATPITFNGEIKNVPTLLSRLDGYDFVKANKEFKSGYLAATIDGDKIKVVVQKDGIYGATEEVQAETEYTLVDIINPSAVQAQMAQDGTNQVKVYVLDSNNKLYLSIFDANPATHAGIQTYELKVDGIDSFVSLNVPLVDENAVSQNYVVFKTTDGSYYTDYSFDGTLNLSITKITMDAQLETTDQEVPQTNISEENSDGLVVDDNVELETDETEVPAQMPAENPDEIEVEPVEPAVVIE